MSKAKIFMFMGLSALVLVLILAAQYMMSLHQGESIDALIASSPAQLEPEASAEKAESKNPGTQRNHTDARAEGPEEPRQDSFMALSSLHEVHAQLMADGEMTEADVAVSTLGWIDACRWSAFNDQAKGSGRSPIALSGPAAEGLREFCADLIDLEMASVYKSAWEEAAEGVRNRFIELENTDGLDAAIQAAIEAIFSSHSEVEINLAVRTITRRVDLQSPFPGVTDESAAFLFRAIIPYYASLALLCDNLGGCPGHHPLVARHCLYMEIHDGCYQPRDMYHAIEQTLTPIQFEVFWSLMNQIRQMRRDLQTGRP